MLGYKDIIKKHYALGMSGMAEYSARDCAQRPLKLSTLAAVVEHYGKM